MNRRTFLQNAASTAATVAVARAASGLVQKSKTKLAPHSRVSQHPVDVSGHTLLAEFDLHGTHWKAYEDLRTRDGVITFTSPNGGRVLNKTAEAAFQGEEAPYLGMTLEEIGMSPRDLLADKLLASGDDPDPTMVMKAVPPHGSAQFRRGQENPDYRPRWDTFAGTVEALDTAPIYPSGSTRTYHPNQDFPEITPEVSRQRFDGLLGGWMPAVRKVMPLSGSAYIEILIFGDVEAHDEFIVQTWHRTSRVENGKVTKVVYAHSYPEYPPARVAPKPEEFYRALLVFANYWDGHLHDFAATSLPDDSYVDMSKHCFAKELMVRPRGVYPKYGAVDRDYYGSEYDGFQDIFTMAVETNLEWGRFDEARKILDNYLGDFTDDKGMIDMRGPETAQFGMTLSLLARYYHYTHDGALLGKYRKKILATIQMLNEMHDASLKLSPSEPGYGIIHGWSESDACLHNTPSTWWLPYYANNAWTARGFIDIARAWEKLYPASRATAQGWAKRAQQLRETMLSAMQKNLQKDKNPPYINFYAGATKTFWESMQTENPTPQLWAHRPYAELLHADMLPAEMANTVIDCMRAYGATTIGIVANVERPHKTGRDILGFISYGYALELLRLDRIEEYLLFLYSHRYHDHSRGSWIAGEVSGVTGGQPLFCIPAQQTIPLLVRWMLVLEDSDDDRLYLAKAVPREWVLSGKPVSIEQAPTRWGKVSLNMVGDREKKTVTAKVNLAAGAPKEIQVKLRVPKNTPLQSVTVNGRPGKLSGAQKDTVVIATGKERQFEIVGRL
ncbi:MAG: Tat pathway signal protein [Acidobacteriaceae bacterium]